MIKKIIAIIIGGIIGMAILTGCDSKPTLSQIPYYDPDHGIDRTQTVGMLFENGKSDYSVVISDAATEAEVQAAGELVYWISQSTGVTLNTVTEGNAATSGSLISVGRTAYAEQNFTDKDFEACLTDGFIIRTVGADLLICGANDRGTLYAVYDFLEKYFGIRFLTNDDVYVPKKADCALYNTNIVEAPAFEYRNIYSYQMNSQSTISHYVRLRMHAPECSFVTDTYGGKTDWYTEFNVIHNAFYWVPTTYYDEHPELFSSKDGVTLSEAGEMPAQLCLTNGITDDGRVDESLEVSTFKVALDTFKRLILETQDTGENFFFFGQNDYLTARCQCERCLKSVDENGGYSGVNIRFLNLLLQEIRKWMQEQGIDRHIRLGTFAYQFTQYAPVEKDENGNYRAVNDSVIPDRDLFIRIAINNSNEYYSLFDSHQEEGTRRQFEMWGALTGNLMVWTYEMNAYEYLWYFPTVYKYAENIRKFKDYGLVYVMLQHNYNGFGSWQADMHTYVGAKLLWNPYRSTQELIDEYVTAYYGMAADDVKMLMDRYNAHYELLANADNDWYMGMLLCEELYRAEYYPVDFLEDMIALMDNAIEKVKASDLPEEERDSLVLKLRKVRLTPCSMLLKNYNSYYSEGRMDFAIKFFEECEACGVQRITESYTMDQYKAQYGL